MRRSLEIYPLLGPLLLTPLALWLWWREFQGAWPPTLTAVGIPILWAYLVPAVGTNLLQVWEFDVRFRLGRFRPQHGFVFGSATAVLTWLVHLQPAADAVGALRFGLVLACVLGWVNLLYDIKALQAGILRVYNQPWAEGQGAQAVAMDYAPWFFGGFGASYGLALGLLEWQAPTRHWVPIFLGILTTTIVFPVAGYMLQSKRNHGHWGLRPIGRTG